MGAPLGKNPQPNTLRSGTLKKCPITQLQHDCEDVLTDGRQSKMMFLAFVVKILLLSVLNQKL